MPYCDRLLEVALELGLYQITDLIPFVELLEQISGVKAETPLSPFLFQTKGEPWSTDKVSDLMKTKFEHEFKQTVTIRRWRDIAIAIDQRFLLRSSCRESIARGVPAELAADDCKRGERGWERRPGFTGATSGIDEQFEVKSGCVADDRCVEIGSRSRAGVAVRARVTVCVAACSCRGERHWKPHAVPQQCRMCCTAVAVLAALLVCWCRRAAVPPTCVY